MEERCTLRYNRLLHVSPILIWRRIRVASNQPRRIALVYLVINLSRCGFAGNWRFGREERGVSRWNWGPESTRNEDTVDICPVDVREVELQRKGNISRI